MRNVSAVPAYPCDVKLFMRGLLYHRETWTTYGCVHLCRFVVCRWVSLITTPVCVGVAPDAPMCTYGFVINNALHMCHHWLYLSCVPNHGRGDSVVRCKNGWGWLSRVLS